MYKKSHFKRSCKILMNKYVDPFQDCCTNQRLFTGTWVYLKKEKARLYICGHRRLAKIDYFRFFCEPKTDIK